MAERLTEDRRRELLKSFEIMKLRFLSFEPNDVNTIAGLEEAPYQIWILWMEASSENYKTKDYVEVLFLDTILVFYELCKELFTNEREKRIEITPEVVREKYPEIYEKARYPRILYISKNFKIITDDLKIIETINCKQKFGLSLLPHPIDDAEEMYWVEIEGDKLDDGTSVIDICPGICAPFRFRNENILEETLKITKKAYEYIKCKQILKEIEGDLKKLGGDYIIIMISGRALNLPQPLFF